MAVSHAEFCKPWKTGKMGPWDHPGTLRANRAGAVSVRAGGSGLGPPLEGFETTPHVLWLPANKMGLFPPCLVAERAGFVPVAMPG